MTGKSSSAFLKKMKYVMLEALNSQPKLLKRPKNYIKKHLHENATISQHYLTPLYGRMGVENTERHFNSIFESALADALAQVQNYDPFNVADDSLMDLNWQRSNVAGIEHSGLNDAGLELNLRVVGETDPFVAQKFIEDNLKRDMVDFDMNVTNDGVNGCVEFKNIVWNDSAVEEAEETPEEIRRRRIEMLKQANQRYNQRHGLSNDDDIADDMSDWLSGNKVNADDLDAEIDDDETVLDDDGLPIKVRVNDCDNREEAIMAVEKHYECEIIDAEAKRIGRNTIELSFIEWGDPLEEDE